MKKTVLLLATLALLPVASAQAGPITLTFEGLGCLEPVQNFYDGGFGGAGSGPGPSDGITFSSNALALQEKATTGGACPGNFIHEPSPDTVMIFASGSGVTMDAPAGFTTGFSFFYATSVEGSVQAYSGLDGTGSLLASMTLPVNTLTLCTSGAFFCTWTPVSVSFAGTVESVFFGDTVLQTRPLTGFDNIGIGSSTPSAVPEPASLLLIGSGLLVGARRARRFLGERRGR